MRFWWLKFGLIALGLFILYISMARMGLEMFRNEDEENKIRNNPVVFNQETYKFTAAGMLPDNPFYLGKQFRDWLWLWMSHGRLRTRVALLVGDKRMIEATELFKKGKDELAIQTVNEAIDKLQYADFLVDNRDMQLKKQIVLAGFAYRELLRRSDKIEGIKSQNWAKLIERIDDWNL